MAFIYVAECEKKFCKIGYSDNPEKRLSNLRGSNPFEVNLVKTYETKELDCTKWLEAFIHEEMKKLGHHRWCEWFVFTSRSMFDLDCIIGSIDYEILNKKVVEKKYIEYVSCAFRLDEFSRYSKEIYYKLNKCLPVALRDKGFPEAARLLGEYGYKGVNSLMDLEDGAVDYLDELIKSDKNLIKMTKSKLKGWQLWKRAGEASEG